MRLQYLPSLVLLLGMGLAVHIPWGRGNPQPGETLERRTSTQLGGEDPLPGEAYHRPHGARGHRHSHIMDVPLTLKGTTPGVGPPHASRELAGLFAAQ